MCYMNISTLGCVLFGQNWTKICAMCKTALLGPQVDGIDLLNLSPTLHSTMMSFINLVTDNVKHLVICAVISIVTEILLIC